MHMRTCIYISPQLVHARLCNGAAASLPWKLLHVSSNIVNQPRDTLDAASPRVFCGSQLPLYLVTSLARTSCRLSFPPVLLPLREPAALLLAR